MMNARRRRWSVGEKPATADQKYLHRHKSVSTLDAASGVAASWRSNSLDRGLFRRKAIVDGHGPQRFDVKFLWRPSNDELELLRSEERQRIAGADFCKALCEARKLRRDRTDQEEFDHQVDVVCQMRSVSTRTCQAELVGSPDLVDSAP